MSNDDVAFACAYEMVVDDESGAVQRVHTALGLMWAATEFPRHLTSIRTGETRARWTQLAQGSMPLNVS
jgi:hypothetical protein